MTLDGALILVVFLVVGHAVVMRPLPGRRHSVFYDWYLRSPIWRLRRLLWYWTSDRRCEGCGRRMTLHRGGLRYRMGAPVMTVHHRDYRRLGRERRRDVSLLCWRCHGGEDSWRYRT